MPPQRVGLEAVLDLSKWTPNVAKYISDIGKMTDAAVRASSNFSGVSASATAAAAGINSIRAAARAAASDLNGVAAAASAAAKAAGNVGAAGGSTKPPKPGATPKQSGSQTALAIYDPAFAAAQKTMYQREQMQYEKDATWKIEQPWQVITEQTQKLSEQNGVLVGWFDKAKQSVANFGNTVMNVARTGIQSFISGVSSLIGKMGSLVSSVLNAINPFNALGNIFQIITGIQISNLIDRLAQGFRNLASNAITATAETQRFTAWLQGALATEIARGTPVQREMPVEMTAEEEEQYQDLLKKRITIENKMAIASKKASEQQQDDTEAETEKIKEQYRWQIRLEELWDDMKDAVGARDAIRANKLYRQIKRTEKERDMALADQAKSSRKSSDIAESALMRQSEQMRLYQEQLEEISQTMKGLAGRTSIQTVYEDPIEIAEAYKLAEEKTKELYNTLRDITYETRMYSRATVEAGFKSLVSYGLGTKQAVGLMSGLTKIGAAQGINNEQMDKWSYNLAQALRYNQFYEKDVRDLATSGFRFDQFLQAISKHTGKSVKTVEQLNKAIRSGAITWDDISAATEEWGGTQDFIVDKMRKTLPAVQTGFGSLLSYIGPDVLGKSADVVAGILDRVLSLLEKMQKQGDFKKIGEELGKMVETWLTPLTEEGGLIDKVEAWFSAGGEGGVSGLVKAIFGTDNINVGEMATGLVNTVIGGIRTAISTAAPAIGKVGQGLWEALVGTPDKMVKMPGDASILEDVFVAGKPGLLQKAQGTISDLLGEMYTYVSGSEGQAQLKSIGEWIFNAIKDVVTAASKIGELQAGLAIAIAENMPAIIGIGSQIGAGLAEGIIIGLGKELGLDVNSPVFKSVVGALVSAFTPAGAIASVVEGATSATQNYQNMPQSTFAPSAWNIPGILPPAQSPMGGQNVTISQNLTFVGSWTEGDKNWFRREAVKQSYETLKLVMVEAQ